MKKQSGRSVKAKTPVKRRSRSAAALASSHYRPRVLKSAKAYNRKTKTRDEEPFEP